MSQNQMVWIDTERCTGCGACIDACPVGAITLMDGKAQVDEKSCTGCGACLEVCTQEAIQPLVQGELVQMEKSGSISASSSYATQRTPTVQPSRPLAETVAPALAVAGAGLLAKATRALARAVVRWLEQPSQERSLPETESPPQPRAGRANGRGRRMRRRRRGR